MSCGCKDCKRGEAWREAFKEKDINKMNDMYNDLWVAYEIVETDYSMLKRTLRELGRLE